MVLCIMKNTKQGLSAEVIQELRAIYEEQFDDVLNDYEVEEMGLRLLRFFSILVKEPREPAQIKVTDREFIRQYEESVRPLGVDRRDLGSGC